MVSIDSLTVRAVNNSIQIECIFCGEKLDSWVPERDIFLGDLITQAHCIKHRCTQGEAQLRGGSN
jgi:hypothetical protein